MVVRIALADGSKPWQFFTIGKSDHQESPAAADRSRDDRPVGHAGAAFAPGSLHYWQGWAFAAVNLVVSIVFITYFYRRDQEVLARRMLRKETIGAQKVIICLIKQVSCVFYLLCGLDHRFDWSHTWLASVPWWLTVLALLGYIGSYWLFVPVLKANRFAASTIRIESGQVLADIGLYRIVRHPMYSVSLLIWICLPLSLGSFLGLAANLFILPLLVWRLLDEEKMLRRELPGYAAYCEAVPQWRLIPSRSYGEAVCRATVAP